MEDFTSLYERLRLSKWPRGVEHPEVRMMLRDFFGYDSWVAGAASQYAKDPHLPAFPASVGDQIHATVAELVEYGEAFPERRESVGPVLDFVVLVRDLYECMARVSGVRRDPPAPVRRFLDRSTDVAAPAASRVVASAAVQIVHDGRLMVIRRSENGPYELPSAIQVPGESIEDTAIRAGRELVDIEVTIGDLVGVRSDPAFVTAEPDGTAYQETIICFRAVIVGGSSTMANGVCEINWPIPVELAWTDRRGDAIRPDMHTLVWDAVTRAASEGQGSGEP
jgi:hypothetical protein